MAFVSSSISTWHRTTVRSAFALTLLLSAVAAAQPHTFDLEWGSLGSGDGEFSAPRGIAVDGSGNVYVVDLGNERVQKFDSSGAYITQWGSFGSGEGQFDNHEHIAADASGNVFVTDHNNRVQKFDSSGAFITQWGSLGSGDGEFSAPRGIAVDGSGNVYVVDLGNERVQKFDSSGAYITQWGSFGSGEGQFDNHEHIAADASGNVFVTDHNNRVQKFNPPVTSECFYTLLFGAEWPLIAADLGLPEDSVHTPGRRVPERWGLGMVRAVLCNPDSPHHADTLAAYLANVAALESEQVSIADRVAPYKHVLAALLLVNQARQDHFKSLLGLQNVYQVVHGPGGRALGDEIFSDEGDLDGDGVTNADEYDIVIGAGGSLEDFVVAATTRAPAVPLMGIPGLLGLAVALGVLGCLMLLRKRQPISRAS